MDANRSPTRPMRQPWGYIHKPEVGFGFKQLTSDEIDQSVSRLYTVKAKEEREAERPNKPMTKEGVGQMLDRLSNADKSKIPESDRRIGSSVFRDSGIASSFAFKGYN